MLKVNKFVSDIYCNDNKATSLSTSLYYFAIINFAE